MIGAGLVAMPIIALALLALSPQAASIWPHLAANVIPRALGNTALLLLGVGCVCGIIGVSTAWLVTQYEFPGPARAGMAAGAAAGGPDLHHRLYLR